MRFDQIFRAEEFALSLAWDLLPGHVQKRARMCGVDLMGALLLGSRSKQFEIGARLAEQLGLEGSIALPGLPGQTFNLLGATLALGHASNAYDVDDGFNLAKGHPGASFAPAALAASLEQDLRYTEYLAVLVACYELAMRWALAMQDHYGYLHSTGAYGAFGCALAIGKARGFSAERLNAALSAADFHAPLVPVMRSVEHPSMNKDGVPYGAFVGAMASLEAQAGATAKTHLLEMPEYAGHLESLGRRWYIEELYFKPYACCRWAHQPIRACLELVREHAFGHRDIRRIGVHTFEAATRLAKQPPTETNEAQYNIAYPIAAALVHGDVGYEQVKDEALGDVRVLRLMECMDFHIDGALEERFPEERLAWVEIELQDGTKLRSGVCAAAGEAGDPNVNMAWICDKFARLCASLLPHDTIDGILATLRDEDPPVREVVGAINAALEG